MIEDRLTIAPLPEAFSRSNASRAQRTVPSRLVFHTRSQASSERWRKSERSPTPALLTSTSSRPCALPISPISAFTCAVSVTSTAWAVAAPFDLTMAPATSAAASASRSATMTTAPSRAKVSAMARPMPAPAPVTSATLSSSRRIGPLHRPGRLPFVAHRHELLCRARMERHGGVELRLGHAELERHRRHLRDLGGVGSEHVATEHPVRFGIDDELHQHLLVAAADHGFERPEPRLVNIDFGEDRARRVLGEADRADLGLRKHRGRDEAVIDRCRL